MKKLYILIIAICVAFASSAMASDWNFYGSARITSFYTDGEHRDPRLDYDLQGNSRFGANVKVTDTLSARFEYGASNSQANIRLFYGVWNFGGGELLIGQTYAPVWLPVSNQAFAGDNGLAGWGENYPGRVPQIQLRFGDLKLALVQANNQYYPNGGAHHSLTSRGTRVDFPGIQAKYRLKMDSFDVSLAGAYQTFHARGSKIDSHMLAGRIGYELGAFAIKASGFFGTNVGNFAEQDVTGYKGRKGHAIVRKNFKMDVDGYGYALVGQYTATDWMKFEMGYGYAKTERDRSVFKGDDVRSYYLQSTITLAPGVTIVPEVGLLDYRDRGQRDANYYGIKWQINF